MKITDLPASELGRIAAFFQAFFMIMLATILFLAYGIQILWFYQVTGLKLILAAAFVTLPSIASFILGLVAMIRNKDRNIAVVLSVIVGAVVLVFLTSLSAGVIFGKVC